MGALPAYMYNAFKEYQFDSDDPRRWNSYCGQFLGDVLTTYASWRTESVKQLHSVRNGVHVKILNPLSKYPSEVSVKKFKTTLIEPYLKSRRIPVYKQLWLLLTLHVCGGSNEMDKEYHRLSSYQAWPHYDHALPTRLSRAGFSYTQQADQVQCFSCGVTLSGWRNRGPPWQEHLTESPNCLFVTGRHTNNVPFLATEQGNSDLRVLTRTGQIFDQNILEPLTSHLLTTNINDEAASTATGDSRVKCRNSQTEDQVAVVPDHDQLVASHESSANPTTIANNQPRDAGSTTQPVVQNLVPRHPEFSDYASRLETFLAGWPSGKEQTAQHMAEAGFFYAGNADCVRCFCCHGGLQNWLPGDSSWVEHARWFPRCQFVRSTQGTGFVEAVARGDDVVPRPYNNHAVSEQNTAENLPNSRPSLGERSLSPVPLPSSTSQPPFDDLPPPPPATPNGAGSGQNQQDSSSSGSSSDNDRGHTSNALTVTVSAAAVAAAVVSTRKKKRKRNKRNHKTNNDLPSETEIAAMMQAKNELEEKNRELREAERCKVCMDEDISIVFLPCGHRVTCSSCAANLRNCPMCRTLIRGTVRSYLV